MLPRASLTAALYVRVSTLDQNDGMQRTELRLYCERMGWRIVEYAEKKSSVRKRPAYDQLMADARERKFDVVVVFIMSRSASSPSVLNLKDAACSHERSLKRRE
jgi:DNA invertase Pin-like site-specific DNA recombinase